MAAAVLLALLALTGAAPPDEPQRPHVEKVGPGRYRVGTVMLDARTKTVRLQGKVNMDEGGPIELLACLPEGKVHESVFVVECRPMDLQVALLLLGRSAGRNPAFQYAEGDPDRDKPPGDPLWVLAEWEEEADGGKQHRRERAERFLYNVQRDTPLQHAEWTFLGSEMFREGFGAELTGTVITTYHDPVAVLELAHETVRDDIFYHVNDKLCPERDTPVELIVRVPPEPEESNNTKGEREHDERQHEEESE
ncbi:MAG: YdjY domain-containing protein [Candidatus Brocadiia bacterium]